MTVDTAAGLHLLAIMAHPDDAELACGGTLIRAADQGYRTGILDLTAGESGSFGDPPTRKAEAEAAAEILGLHVRRTAGLPDGRLRNTIEARNVVAASVRELRPQVVILHGRGGRHPDHRVARQLGFDACFISGLRNAPLAGEAFRPRKILYALSFVETSRRPTFVVDISDQMERKLDAIFAYRSQLFEQRTWAGDLFGGGTRSFRDQILAHSAHYGSFVRRPFGEPFHTRETVRVDDVVALDVNSL